MSRPKPGPFATDLDKYYAIRLGGKRGLRSRVGLWLLDADLQAVASFRFDQAARAYFAKHKLAGLVPLIISVVWRRRMSNVHQAFINRKAQIGPGFFIMHRNGLFIGPVSIGDNCVVHQNVTMGEGVANQDRGVPRLGDNVWIGPGAMIFGDITIGNNVTISAGTVLSKSVPDDCLVAGNPGRVIQRDYDNRSLINFTVPKMEDGPNGTGTGLVKNLLQQREPSEASAPADDEEDPGVSNEA